MASPMETSPVRPPSAPSEMEEEEEEEEEEMQRPLEDEAEEKEEVDSVLRMSFRDYHRSLSWTTGSQAMATTAIHDSSSGQSTPHTDPETIHSDIFRDIPMPQPPSSHPVFKQLAKLNHALSRASSRRSSVNSQPGYPMELDVHAINAEFASASALSIDMTSLAASSTTSSPSGKDFKQPLHQHMTNCLCSVLRNCFSWRSRHHFHQMNDAQRQKQSEQEFVQHLVRDFFESSWILLILLGICTSSVAWCVDEAAVALEKLHFEFTKLAGDSNWLFNYALYIIFRALLLLTAVAFTYYGCPDAAGSGIPEMRSILGGFVLPNYLQARAFAVKALGLVLALGSGLSIGKEGPFVHLSCITARQLIRIPLFRTIRRSQDLTHHILAAACALGVTSTFGAPIGGVLFSIEVTSTFYMTSNYWRAFFVSVVGVIVFRTLNQLFEGSNVSLFTTEFDVLPYKSYEIGLFVVLAMICGVLAALFVRCFQLVLNMRSCIQDALVRHCRLHHCVTESWPFVYALLVASAFAAVEYPIGSFMRLSQREVIDDMFSATNLNSTEDSHLNSSLHRSWNSPSLALNLVVFLSVRFIETVVSATVMVPSGIVTPVFAIGAVLGRLFGEIIVFLGGGNSLAGGYAVVGAASFTAGVTGTVSIAVIVFELTSQLSYMIPVLLCVLVGRAVALFFALDMYETISRQKNLPQWPDLTKQKSYSLIASDLMIPSPSYFLSRQQTLHSLRKLLTDAPKHVNGFPVVDDVQTMIYLGVVDRSEIESLVEVWQACLEHSHTSVRQEDEDESIGRLLTPTTRRILMTSRVALAALNAEQTEALCALQSAYDVPVDLVKLELLSLDAINFHVQRDTFASQVILLFSVHKCPQLFVTARGKLLGVIFASDLLARNRQFML